MRRGRGGAHRAAHGQPPAQGRQERPGQGPRAGRRARSAADGDRPGLGLPVAARRAAPPPRPGGPRRRRRPAARHRTRRTDGRRRHRQMAPAAGHLGAAPAKQQKRLTQLGITPAETPSPAPAAKGTTEGKARHRRRSSRAWRCSHSGWNEGAHGPAPRGHSEEIAVDGETDPVAIKLGAWTLNTRARRDRFTREQLEALRKLGVEWASVGAARSAATG